MMVQARAVLVTLHAAPLLQVWDVTAADPKLLVYLKAYRNTVPVPRHWSQKRKYLQVSGLGMCLCRAGSLKWGPAAVRGTAGGVVAVGCVASVCVAPVASAPSYMLRALSMTGQTWPREAALQAA